MAEAEAYGLDGNRDKVPKYSGCVIGLRVRPLWLLAPMDLAGHRWVRIACIRSGLAAECFRRILNEH